MSFLQLPPLMKLYFFSLKWCSQPSVSTSSESLNSINCRWKIIGKKFPKVPKRKTWICPLLTAIYISFTLYLQLFTQYYNYFHHIYIVLDVINNLEMISSIQEDMCRLYAKNISISRRELSNCRFWCLVLQSILHRHQEMTLCQHKVRESITILKMPVLGQTFTAFT